MKADPRDLIQAHYATLVDNRNGRPRPLDHVAFEGLPVAVFIGCLVIGVSLKPEVSAGLLTVAGLLSAFFFQTMLQIAQRSMEWADEEPLPGPDTSRRAEFLKQIAANAGYASLVCIATAAVFVGASVAQGTALTVLSALGLALAVHLILVLLMVLVRVFALTKERLRDTRTGYKATVTALPERKAG
jgi:small-conductance mechanosensitive channel